MANDITLALRKVTEDRMQKILTQTAIGVGNGLMRNTPVEGGHLHTAWANALGQVPGVLEQVRRDPGESHDPAAAALGSATVKLTGNDQFIRLSNRVSFVRIVEYGGRLEPIDPGGTKNSPQGTYHGSRNAPPRYGAISWTDAAGEVHFARHSDYPARHPVQETIAEVKQRLAKRFQVS